MRTLKTIALSLIVGAILGTLGTYFIMTLKTTVQSVKRVEVVSVGKNAKEITEQPTAEVKLSLAEVELLLSINTPQNGDIVTRAVLDRRSLQYNHEINVGAVYLVNSKAVLVELDYAYKRFGIGLLAGYSFELKDYEVGIKLFYRHLF